MARILITGATGSLGRRVAALAVAAGHTVLGTHVRPWIEAVDGGVSPSISPVRLDIRDREAVQDVVDAAAPDLVIHTAAGRDRNDWVTNADGAANVALACGERVRLVHVSSDAIFSGRAGREYTEADRPDPIYPYGAAKAAAETAVRAIAPGAVVVRTSLILGDGNGGHEHLTHDLVAGRADGALFTDEVRRPVHVDDLADALLELGAGDFRGVINVAGADPVSRYDLGVLVAERDGLDVGKLRSASGSGRPGDIRLDVGLASGLLHTRLRGAYEFMRAR
ncbi:sugar nucleotide-binding protein [Dactylosporangium sp. NPDC049140]|uniref:SDR family oxidoreductase n=1 Tax=Dactylosporangium sp. NPDC049140 TaxID=3155647 RepID=UPI0033E7E446